MVQMLKKLVPKTKTGKVVAAVSVLAVVGVAGWAISEALKAEEDAELINDMANLERRAAAAGHYC